MKTPPYFSDRPDTNPDPEYVRRVCIVIFTVAWITFIGILIFAFNA